MTEYTASPEAIQEYLSSKERTLHWVRSHSPSRLDFFSPSIPPSDIVDSDRESDVESSDSLPPRMLLKYSNGRPDVPISHYEGHDQRGFSSDRRSGSRDSRSHPSQHPSRGHSRSGSYGHSPVDAPRHHEPSSYMSRQHNQGKIIDPATPGLPEEIRVLPSDPNAVPYSSTHGPRDPARSRSHSYPTEQTSHPHFSSPPRQAMSPPAHASSSHYAPPLFHGPQPQPVTYSHSQPLPSSRQMYGMDKYAPHRTQRSSRPPPAIVYAPGHRSGENYHPPTIVYGPHRAPEMTYTVSAPTPHSVFPQYPRITPTPYPSAHGHLPSVHEEERLARHVSTFSRDPRLMRGEPRRSHTPVSVAESADSGSTYYVIPTPGQKVKVLIPPEASLYTATSTTQSPSSPHSRSSSAKKPFFSRFFSFASRFSDASSKEFAKEKPLRRRFSLDDGHSGTDSQLR